MTGLGKIPGPPDVHECVRVEVWSDVVCPWCYLGEHRLNRALDQLPWGDEIDVRFRAYQLDPRAPSEPRDLRAVIERKYGPGAFDAMTRRLTALGAAEGIEYRFDLTQRVNTSTAHRLLAWAGTVENGHQQDLAEALFRAYFTEGRDVGDHEVLADLASAVGLPADEAAEVAAGSRFADTIARDQQDALEHQVTGVPAFLVGGGWLIPGAQDVDTLVALLTRARDRLGT